MEEPRTRYQIGCIAADIALTLVFLAVYVFFTLRPGALIDGELFSPRRQGDSILYTGVLHDAPGTVAYTPTQDGAQFLLDFSPHFSGEYQVAFGKEGSQGRETIFSSGEDLLWEGYYSQDEFLSLRDKNGDYTDWVEIYSTPYNWNEFTPPMDDLVKLAAGDNVHRRGSWVFFAVTALLGAVMALTTAFPMAFFKLQHFLDVRDPEPTDFYLATAKLSWAIGPVLLLILYCVGLTYLS